MSNKPKESQLSLFDDDQPKQVDKKAAPEKETKVIYMSNYQISKLKSVEDDFRALSDKWL